ncbi:PREDICTED: mitochondrial ribosome-associated GTPase 2 isoform X2 [Polistes canadensis]|uniref:mitochondrial ribosome-associated GTPase 2 isoform X2 n=1 Tax=Polistes canadensis TaxID=91411 RepID=UPI000718F6B5|nr:PREDICTED: mitochondrial ribosome-associated GTPase 2 isoform X2 [Polistes canadensis]
MKPSIFNENESVLLVGEGNFSFSVALCQLNLKINLITTCFESVISHETGKKNIEYLKRHGIRVLLGIDATKLMENPILKTKSFDKVIFNFPHVGGKMRIEKNRELLRQFFIEIEKLNNSNVEVLITLCNGQGGTPMDEPKRNWNDSWKVTEMAAHGNFILTMIEPFLWSYFPSYIVTGYRSLEKQFHTMHALIHFFRRSEPPNYQNISPTNKLDIKVYESFYTSTNFHCDNKHLANPLRSQKSKSLSNTSQYFVDIKQVRVIGGRGGDGTISFLQLWKNDRAGPDGGDGGHGGHVIFQVSKNTKDLKHIQSIFKAEDGENGASKNCHGKCAEHNIIPVPVGTIIRNIEGTILADLNQENSMFIAARGGAGGHGNPFFTSDTQQSPKICEYGANGEDLQYILEVRSMAHIGLIGFPNAGKSTLLRAISRARPKVASYPFTTLKPHVGMIPYDDYEQISVADLPGLIADSHKNKGLGITFLKHAERCAILLFVIDLSLDKPWEALEILKYEISQFNKNLNNRSLIVVANKMDLPEAEENLKLLKEKIDMPIIPISAKVGINISTLLKEIRVLYDRLKEENDKSMNTKESFI